MIKWKYKVGDHIIDYKENGDLKRDLIIIDQRLETEKIPAPESRKGYLIRNTKWYKYYCNVCKWGDGWIREKELSVKHGCSCCRGLTVVPGINDIATTNPELVQYFFNKEDALKYTYGSGERVELICPICKHTKILRINDLYSYGLMCKYCGDGVSYPEKFIMSVFEQLGVNYIHQLSKIHFDWCGNYKYDFYLTDYGYIIETHGKHHYTGDFQRAGGNNLKQEQENDKHKQNIGIKNGFKDKYIILDCRKSDKEWIINSIKNSKLINIIDIEKVDFDECNRFATNSLVFEVCNYWNTYESNPKEIAKVFKMARTTVGNYLRRGIELGICNYNSKKELEKSINKRSVPCYLILNDRKIYYRSISEASKSSIKDAGGFYTNNFNKKRVQGEQINKRI